MNSDSRKLHVLKQYECGAASRALWPANLQQSVAVGKNAQRRRMIKRLCWSVKVSITRMRRVHLWSIMGLVLGGVLLIMLMLRQRHTLLIGVMLCIVVVVRVVGGSLLSLMLDALSRSSKREAYMPMLQHSPETPIPEAPLIRVLETIDLSTCDVEHFLDTEHELQALPPLQVDEYRNEV